MTENIFNRSGEKDDFEKILMKYKYTPTDFSTVFQDDPSPTNDGNFSINGNVIITNIHNKKNRRYVAGHGTFWLENFEEDLQNGVFS